MKTETETEAAAAISDTSGAQLALTELLDREHEMFADDSTFSGMLGDPIGRRRFLEMTAKPVQRLPSDSAHLRVEQ